MRVQSQLIFFIIIGHTKSSPNNTHKKRTPRLWRGVPEFLKKFESRVRSGDAVKMKFAYSPVSEFGAPEISILPSIVAACKVLKNNL